MKTWTAVMALGGEKWVRVEHLVELRLVPVKGEDILHQLIGVDADGREHLLVEGTQEGCRRIASRVMGDDDG